MILPRRKRSVALVLVVLAGSGSMANAGTVTVVARAYLGGNGLTLKPEIHLYDKSTHKDLWPEGRTQTANNIPPGNYEIEVVQPGFKKFYRDVDVISQRTEVRAVLLVSQEATGHAFNLPGRIVNGKGYEGTWILAVPLAGSPSDVVEVEAASDGSFEVAVKNSGPYLLVVVREDEVLKTRSVHIGSQNREELIDLGKP